MSTEPGAPGASTTSEQQFSIQRVYLKDASLESPNSPMVFLKDWKPEVEVNLGASTNPQGNDHYEVIVNVTVTARSGEDTAFLVEVHQAGIFMVRGYPKDQIDVLLGSYCPGVLFPYAREAISDLVTKGGFPQFVLAPVNFDAIYAERQRQRAGGSGNAPN
ncbi:MAG: protein-export chaperone SecB [Chromatiales bacterium]|nr:protein-export chaperone SecB [Chromatiales bacterium]